jgi:multidrug efflux pump subunit AcrA (membrane-fusion protein)
VTAHQQRDFVPDVLVGQVRPSGPTMQVSLPGTTFAYEAANIYARANGYIQKRNVDIGDHVKAGDLFAELTAPRARSPDFPSPGDAGSGAGDFAPEPGEQAAGPSDQ